MKYDVYRFSYSCYRCEREFVQLYVDKRDYQVGVSPHEILGYLIHKPYAENVKRTFSHTLGITVYGNICPHCGAYQGNTFLFDHFADAF